MATGKQGLREEDLDVSTVRPGAVSRGSGGQTVGQYDAYVRVTHRPTGITVERSTERSQLMNKHAALTELTRLVALRDSQEGSHVAAPHLEANCIAHGTSLVFCDHCATTGVLGRWAEGLSNAELAAGLDTIANDSRAYPWAEKRALLMVAAQRLTQKKFLTDLALGCILKG